MKIFLGSWSLKGAGRRRREVVGRAVIFVGEIFLGSGSKEEGRLGRVKFLPRAKPTGKWSINYGSLCLYV